ncbi:MAG: hypothetical protein J6S87_01280, partial [Bacteroidales bacterium]|nr:hypothetical protein [Bacteroidales bacterium]
ENGKFEDIANVYSSADAVSWNLSENGVNTRTTVYSQEYADASVTYATGGSFTSAGSYPDSFAAAGNKQNLNDGNATMTFWFPPQEITDALKATVTFEIEVNGKREEHTLELDLGARLGSQVWKAGQLRTFTLKPDEVDVEIHDEVSGFVKDQVEITNTGNVDAFIRAHIVANWWGTTGNETGIAMGYTTAAHTAFVETWKMNEDATGDNYGGVFTNLPGTDWVRAQDGYFYYTLAVAPGAKTKTFFDKYELDTTAHPVPEIWYLDISIKKYSNVFLQMEIPVQAIEAKEGVAWDAAWEAALGTKPVAQ